jgi:hypothetical protein
MIRIENHFSESEEVFFSSQLLSSFQRITLQNQPRITDSAAFSTTPLILPENQELGVVPNGASISICKKVLMTSLDSLTACAIYLMGGKKLLQQCKNINAQRFLENLADQIWQQCFPFVNH